MRPRSDGICVCHRVATIQPTWPSVSMSLLCSLRRTSTGFTTYGQCTVLNNCGNPALTHTSEYSFDTPLHGELREADEQRIQSDHDLQADPADSSNLLRDSLCIGNLPSRTSLQWQGRLRNRGRTATSAEPSSRRPTHTHTSRETFRRYICETLGCNPIYDSLEATAILTLLATSSEHMAAMMVSTVISRFFVAKSSETSFWGWELGKE